MMKSYHNTTNRIGYELRDREKKAKNQEGRIEIFFFENFGQHFTAEDIMSQVFEGVIPRSSMARALANLTFKGVLIKSSNTERKSHFNHACHDWTMRAVYFYSIQEVRRPSNES